MKIKFFKAGKWAGKPWEPQIKVEAGEVVDLPINLAAEILTAHGGEVYEAEEEKQTEKSVSDDSAEEQPPVDPLTLSLAEIGISDSMINKLASINVVSVAELIEKTEQDILSLDGVGKAKADDVEDALNEHGLSLKEG